MKPDRHAEHKQHAFDSFCKKVLKCEACNGYREISRRKKHSIPFSELPEDVNFEYRAPLARETSPTLTEI